MHGLKPANRLESAHMGRIASMRCICCELLDMQQDAPTEVHHIREDRQARSHWLTLPLCSNCHRGPLGIHGAKRYLSMLKMGEVDLLACVMERLAKTTGVPA